MRLQHLVVVIPGVLGSTLETLDGKPVWGQDRATLAASLWSPRRLDVDAHPTLVATGLIESIRAMPPLPWGVHGYEQIVRNITNTFAGVRRDVAPDPAQRDPRRDLSADLVLLPYDFRLGVEHAARRLADEVNTRLDGVDAQTRRRRVIVVAHSLGGLVARYWAGILGGAEACRAIITLGTPHRGAPKALDWVINGVGVGGLRLGGVTEIVRGWRSAYDLLPRYPAVWDRAAGRAVYPHELAAVAGKRFAQAAETSYAMHRAIDDAWAELAATGAAPDQLALFAQGHQTLAEARLTGGRLTVSKQDAGWLPNEGWRGGDGTVPAISAVPVGLDEHPLSRQAVPERHMPMPSTKALMENLEKYAAASLAALRGDEPDQPWLGLDLDDGGLAGQPIPVGARLLGVPPESAAEVATWVSVYPDDGERRLGRQSMRPDGTGGWAATLDPLPPGGYRVVVEAVNVPGRDRVTCTDVLAVVDPEADA